MVCCKRRGEYMSAAATVAHDHDIRPPAGHGKLRVLLVEDNPADIELVSRELRRGGFDLTMDVVETEEEFTARVRSNSYQVVLADYNLPQWRGLEALNVLRNEKLDIPLILVSGALGDVSAVECIKQGAMDYVLKDRLARLPVAVLSALQEKRLRDERQRAIDDLAKKVEELSRSNRELEQFAYVASHDLQEPLRMIASYTQLLARRYRHQLDKDANEFISYAVEGATRMQVLINDLLAYSRVGTRGKPFSPTDCNEVLARALDNLKFAIQDAKATVTASKLPTVVGDGTQLTQLFQNLVSNAVKFRGTAQPDVHVDAQLKPAAVGVAQADTPQLEWVFSVRDNGIGIEPQYFERIFVIFQRLHTREQYPGTGIGLAICKKITERHGGRIWVESIPGQGATFLFTVPQV